MGSSMTVTVTELSDKVVVICSDRYVPKDDVQRIIEAFKKTGFELIWLNL